MLHSHIVAVYEINNDRVIKMVPVQPPTASERKNLFLFYFSERDGMEGKGWAVADAVMTYRQTDRQNEFAIETGESDRETSLTRF